jgi:anti-sigma factor RsiW
MDSGRTRDLEKLNALVDGELGPAERAAIAARLAADRDLASAYATLARLKAATAETTEDCPTIVLRQPRWLTVRRHAAAIAACIGLLIGGVLLGEAGMARGRTPGCRYDGRPNRDHSRVAAGRNDDPAARYCGA